MSYNLCILIWPEGTVATEMGARETFVTIRESAAGIGKLKDIRNGQAEVEFFDSPAGPRLIHKHVPVRLVQAVELGAQTRIFAFDPNNGSWKAGRAGGLVSAEAAQKAEDQYLVHFPNGEVEQVPITRLFVRGDRVKEDPTEYLAAKITDTPFFFEGRWRIVRHFAKQRAAFGGMTALASSGIELLEHQVSLVRKVLADPIQRYLLADEVGLGKTIEAGMYETYNREELYQKVWEKPLLRVAEEYGVSSVALGKTCQKLSIPVPGRGHWAKLANGHQGAKKPPPRRSTKSPWFIALRWQRNRSRHRVTPNSKVSTSCLPRARSPRLRSNLSLVLTP